MPSGLCKRFALLKISTINIINFPINYLITYIKKLLNNKSVL